MSFFRQYKKCEILFICKHTEELLHRFYDFGDRMDLVKKYRHRVWEGKREDIIVKARYINNFQAKDMPLWLKDFE